MGGYVAVCGKYGEYKGAKQMASGGLILNYYKPEPGTDPDPEPGTDPEPSAAIDFLLDSSLGLEDASEVTSFTSDGITVTFDKGTNTNVPKYYVLGDAVRVYAGGTVTVSGAEMSKIEFTFGSSDKTNEITVDNGTYADGKWEGSASSVTFTVSGTSGHRRFAKISVTKK